MMYYLHGVQGVASSNPATPTIKIKATKFNLGGFFLWSRSKMEMWRERKKPRQLARAGLISKAA